MFAKRFFYVCGGLLCLALAYHFGAANAKAAPAGNPVIAAAADQGLWVAVTANGDTYSMSPSSTNFVWTRRGNVFTP
jgi:hypothetical protein